MEKKYERLSSIRHVIFAQHLSSRLPFVFSKTKSEVEDNTLDKRERVVREKLARFARIPGSAIFACVLSCFNFILAPFIQLNPSLEPNASPAGLSGEAARSALERHGPNIFATERAPRVIALLLGALLNPFNVILLVLAIVNIATGDKATFTVMVVMVMASTGLRFVFFLHQKKKT